MKHISDILNEETQNLLKFDAYICKIMMAALLKSSLDKKLFHNTFLKGKILIKLVNSDIFSPFIARKWGEGRYTIQLG